MKSNMCINTNITTSTVPRCELVPSGSEQGQVEGSCQHEPPDSIKGWEF